MAFTGRCHPMSTGCPLVYIYISTLRYCWMHFSGAAKTLLWSFRRAKILRRVGEQNCLDLLEDCSTFSKLTQIHAYILKSGLSVHSFVLTKFISVSSHLKAIKYVSSFIYSSLLTQRFWNVAVFNTIIRVHAQSFDSNIKAVDFYKLMLVHGVSPNKLTYPLILKACAGINDLNLGWQIHGSVLKLGFEDDGYVQNAMLHMYCCCRDGIEFAENLFDHMPKRNLVCWSAIINGYVRLGRSSDALELFRKMQTCGVRPDEITMISVASACTDLGALELGRWIESCIERENVEKTVELSNVLVDMFAKCGDIDKAIGLFRNMKEKTIESWTSAIFGLAMHGKGLEVICLFEEMKASGIELDEVSFIGLLTACSHSGLVEEGKRYFDSMVRDHEIMPRIEHYGCMVDLFCRKGLVIEAVEFVEKMPVAPNSVIWRTLISACRVAGELWLGESISKKLLRSESMCQSNYVLLSNIYGKNMNWEKKTMVREVMEKMGLKKIPGSSVIELGGEIYEFVSGDKTHLLNAEIYEMVDYIGRELNKAGYVPAISEVLLDIDEDKGVALYTYT